MPPVTSAASPDDDSEEIIELAPEAALIALEKGSIDTQVATAKRYPRSLSKFMAAAREAVTLDPDTAAGCFYKLKRKDKNGEEKFIEGPSVRLLEICASAFQNIRYGARVVGIDDKFVVAQGVAHDIENNVYQSIEVRRRITTSKGKRYGDDMIGVTSNAACSIAKRNALNGIVPRVYVNQLMDLAKETAIGDLKTLAERRQKAVAYFTDKLGVPAARVFAYLEVAGLEDMRLVHLEQLTGLRTALREGDTTLEDAFSAKPETDDTPAPAESKGMFAGAQGAKPAETKQPQNPAPATQAESKAPASDAPPLASGTPTEPAANASHQEEVKEGRNANESIPAEAAGGRAPVAPAASDQAPADPRVGQNQQLAQLLQASEIPLSTLMGYLAEAGFVAKTSTSIADIPDAEIPKIIAGWNAVSKILQQRLAAQGPGRTAKRQR